MKYRGGAGGDFVKFEKVGDGVSGTVESTGSLPNKFKGNVDTVIYVRTSDGIKAVRCDKKALADAAAQIMASGGFRRGERIEVRFESTYTSKQFKNNPGKDITIDLPDRADTGEASVPSQQSVPQTSAVEHAYDQVVKAKGEAAAKAIRAAVEGVAKNDPAKQADLLLKAVAA